MKVLAVDTATEACSAALLCDDEIHARFEIAPRRHNQRLFVLCDELLAEADLSVGSLDALVFGRGPGAFTGVRIAAAFAQGAAFAHDLPVVPISDLHALAQEMMEKHTCGQVLAAMDARMGEIYYGYFQARSSAEGTLIMPAGKETVAPPGAVRVAENVAACGSGFAAYPELIEKIAPSALDETLLPKAAIMLKLARPEIDAGRVYGAEQAVPVYLRSP